MWTTIFNTIKALGALVGLYRDARQAVTGNETSSEPAPADAAAQRAGTAAGAAAHSAGMRAGKVSKL